MASATQWTWIWVDSRSWWWTGRPGVLRFMGSQRVRHNWVTELNWTELKVSRVWVGVQQRRSSQFILEEINPEYSLEGLMLKLKLQFFSHLMWRANSLEKTLSLGKMEGRRRRGWQRMKWLGGIMDSMNMIQSKSRRQWWTGSLLCCIPWGHKESDTTEWLNNNNNHVLHASRWLTFSFSLLFINGEAILTGTFDLMLWWDKP